MGFLELISLDGVWEFVKPLLSDQIKQRLKPKGSSDKAKEKLFNLYSALTDCKVNMRSYLSHLEEMIRYMEQVRRQDRIEETEYNERLAFLVVSTQKIMGSLSRVEHWLEDLDPQFSIYADAINSSLKKYIMREIDILCNPALAPGMWQSLRNQLDGWGEEKENSPNLIPSDWEELLEKIPSSAELQDVLEKTKKNAKLIEDCVDELRRFTRDQFQFKEAF